MSHRRNLSLIRSFTLTIALLGVLSVASTPARADQPPARAMNEKYMFSDEIKPGMKGYGLTVFSGTEIEKFDVEILDVLYGIEPRGDLILAKIAGDPGGPIERAGVIAGMSGSPIYIEDRMIGALAYSWAFSKEAIAGITPIEEMLRIFDFDSSKASTGAAAGAGEPAAWAGGAGLNVRLSAAAGSVEMQPIMTPMVFSGFSREAIEMFRPELEGWGIIPVVGGSSTGHLGGHSAGPEATLEEGAAIGILMVGGDMIAAAVGTVTLNDGGRILGFGHPFMLSGAIDFPMTTAYIHTILPSLIFSSKIGSPLKPVGSLTQDRSSGIGGVVGAVPAMIPITLAVNAQSGYSSESFNFEVVRHRRLFPSLTAMAVVSVLAQASSGSGDFAAEVHYDIKLEGFPTISNDGYISGRGGFPSLTAMELHSDLRALLNNQFAEVVVESVSIDVRVKEAVESARITGARVIRETVEPGDDVHVKVLMKPYMKDPIEKKFSLKIPEHFPEGRAFLQISAAPQTAAFERRRAPSRFRPGDIDSLLRLIDEDYPGNRLDVRLLVADPGMVVDGKEMPALPSSVFAVMSNAVGRELVGVTRASVMLEEHFFMDFKIEGAVIIPIKIDRKAL